MASPLQIWTYLAAVVDLYNASGGNLLPKEEVEQRFQICCTSGPPEGEPCIHFTGRGCKLCGCCTNQRKSLFNKLAFPNEGCPDGRWQPKG